MNSKAPNSYGEGFFESSRSPAHAGFEGSRGKSRWSLKDFISFFCYVILIIILLFKTIDLYNCHLYS